MPVHAEALLALLRVFEESAIGKSKTPDRPIFIDPVNNPATVERAKSKMLDEHSNTFTRLDGRIRPAELNSGNFEHFPSQQSMRSLGESDCTMAEVDAASEHRVTSG